MGTGCLGGLELVIKQIPNRRSIRLRRTQSTTLQCCTNIVCSISNLNKSADTPSTLQLWMVFLFTFVFVRPRIAEYQRWWSSVVVGFVARMRREEVLFATSLNIYTFHDKYISCLNCIYDSKKIICILMQGGRFYLFCFTFLLSWIFFS